MPDPLKREFELISDDAEVSAIQIVLSLISEMPFDSRKRVLNYVNDYHNCMTRKEYEESQASQ